MLQRTKSYFRITALLGIFFWTTSSIANVTPSRTYTLDDFYYLALQENENILNVDLDIKISRAQKNVSLSRFFPKIDVANDFSLFDRAASFGRSADSFENFTRISLSHILFDGLGSVANLKRDRALLEASKLQSKVRRLQLFEEISQVFFQYLSLLKEEENIGRQVRSTENRVQTLKERVRIGRSKETDSLESLSQLNSLKADLLQIKADKEELLKLARLVSGRDDLDDIKIRDNFPLSKLQIRKGWDSQLHEKLEFDLYKNLIKSATYEIRSKKSAFFPTVTANINTYPERPNSFNEDYWDVTFEARWNLLSGGSKYAELKKAKLEKRKVENDFSYLKRDIETEWDKLKKVFKLKQEELKALEETLRLSRKNYQTHLKEYDLSLVSNLDVIQSQRNLIDVERKYYQSYYETKYLWNSLRAFVEDLPL